MRGALLTSAPSAQMRAAFLSYQVAGAIGAFVRQNRKEGTPAMNILADPNMTDSEAALAALAPFVGLRRKFYGVVVADPASKFKSYTAIQSTNPSSRRDNERHYKTMSFTELAALPVKELAAPTGCHLFLWTSGPFLPQALRVIEAWGFKYSTRAFTWLKTQALVGIRRSIDGVGFPRRPRPHHKGSKRSRVAGPPRQLPAPAQGRPRADSCSAARAFPQTG